MKIKARLTLNTFISLGTLILVLLSLVWSWHEIINADRNMKLVDTMRRVAFERILLRDEYLLYQEERSGQQWHVKSEVLRSLLESAASHFGQEEDKALLLAARKDFDATVAGFSRIMADRAGRDAGLKIKAGFSDGELRQISQVFLKAYSLTDNINRLHESAQAATKRVRNSGAFVVLWVIFVGILAIIINSTIIRRTLAQRITALGNGVEIIGAGNLDYRIETGGNDELSDLAVASNEMAGKLQQSYTSVGNLQKEMAERKKAEELLREQEHWLRESQRVGGIGSYILDFRTNVWRSSSILDEIFGIGEEAEKTVESWHKLVHPDDREEILSYFTHVVAEEKKNFNREYRVIRKNDGEVRWLWGLGELGFDTDGTLTNMTGVILDITERKRAEDALRASEERYRHLFNAMDEGFCIIEMIFNAAGRPVDFRFLEVNPAFEKQTGLHGAEGKLMRELAPAHEEFWFEIFGNIALTGEAVHVMNEASALNRWFDVYAYRVGRPEDRHVAIVFNDMTERKQADEKIMRVLTDLQRSNKELELFAYVASHDLQEPLRMISSYTQLLAERYKDKLDDKANLFIHYAVDGAVRMQLLINDLLAFSRIGTKGKPREPVDSQAVLGQAINNLKMNIEETQTIITNDHLPEVRADASQLAQLFQNLIGNAIKFRGEANPHIHIAAQDEGEEWLFSVRDNGIGIDPQFSDKVFVIFQRLHTKEEYPGSGIGLAICKKIVERHDGRIWFESEPGNGATFYFTMKK